MRVHHFLIFQLAKGTFEFPALFSAKTLQLALPDFFCRAAFSVNTHASFDEKNKTLANNPVTPPCFANFWEVRSFVVRRDLELLKIMPSGQRVYVGNLANDVRERDVEKFFKGFGKLGEISIKNGYGFVDFEDYRDADDAVHDLDGKEIRGSR